MKTKDENVWGSLMMTSLNGNSSRVTGPLCGKFTGHICITKQTLIGPDICLSPDQRQAVIYTNAGILLIGPLGTNFSEILSEIHTLSYKKTHLKMSFG